METLTNYGIIALNFINENLTFIFAGFALIYGIIMLYFLYKYNKEKKENKILKSLTGTLSSIIIDNLKENIKLEKTLNEVRKNRDRKYNQHNTQIAYFKKRFFALDLVIQDTFKDNVAFIKLIKNDFYDLQKKSFKELRKLKKQFTKKKK